MDDVGQTLLNWASAFGTQEMVEFLCAKGETSIRYLSTLAFLGPNRTRCHSCDFRAQNRLGLQGNPIHIPLVMDTAA